MNFLNRKTVSCFVAVKNNPAITKLCLDTLSWVDEIILVDSSTNDDIKTLAKNYENLTYYFTENDNIKEKVIHYSSLSKTEYVMLASFDEFFSEAFKNDILNKLETQDFNAIECHPHDFNFGLDYGVNRAHFYNKIIKKELIKYYKSETLHETIQVNDKIIRCEVPYTHISNSLLIIYIIKNYKYEMISLEKFSEEQLNKKTYFDFNKNQLYYRTLKDWLKFNYHFLKNIWYIRKTGHKAFYSAYCNLMNQIIRIISPTEESFIRNGKVDRKDTRGYL